MKGNCSADNLCAGLVSIITPTYNHEKYIADCIRSVMAQTYQNWEMIIIDDGSTDRTSEIITSFSDSRIKYIRQAHLGGYKLGAIYNKALSATSGEFIAILEGDDFWPPNKLAIQLPYFSDKDIILTYGDCILTKESGRPILYRKIIGNETIRDNNPVGSALNEFLNARNFIYAQTIIIRKEALVKIGGFIQPDYLYLVDYPTLCRLSLAGKFKGIPRLLGYWRRNVNSLTLSNYQTISDGFIRYVKEFITTYQAQIQDCIRINAIDSDLLLKANGLSASLKFALKHQNYTRGMITLVYGYNKSAKNYFKQYLKQEDKKFSYAFISVIGLVLATIPVLNIILPAVGIYLSRPLIWLKRLLLK